MENKNSMKNSDENGNILLHLKKKAYIILQPLIRFIDNQKIRRNASEYQRHFQDVIESIKKSKRTKLNFAAYVVYDSSFGMATAIDVMLSDTQHWNPQIVVIPDISRGFEHAKEQYIKTKQFFIDKYGEAFVSDGWNYDLDIYYDYLDEFDIVYYANPYDYMVKEFHSIKYACTKNVLPIYVSYGYEVGKLTTLARLRGPELNYVWKLFADTTYTYNDYLKYQVIKGKNVVLAGYSKMDDLYNYPMKENNRKRILISPHHTVSSIELPLSNFLSYSDYIMELPLLFPQVDFVFRPHPLLFTNLVSKGLWNKEKVERYISGLKDRGIEYSEGGSYLKIFAECDAIINDSGSFTVEWLYTGKPGCFVYNNNLSEKLLTNLMNQALRCYTIAKNEKDITDFITRVINDTKDHNYEMNQWVKDNVAINYPNVSHFIMQEIDILNMH